MPLTSINDYEITYEIRPEYLLVRVGLARNDYNIARQYWTDVVRLVQRRKDPKVVVEVSSQEALPAKDAHGLMTDISKLIVPEIKVAIVNPQVVPLVRTAVESSAMVQGRTMKIFDTLAAAELWLREDGGTDRAMNSKSIYEGDIQDHTDLREMH